MRVPWPVPDVPFGNANHAAPADAVHAHPVVVVIAMDWSPPLAFTFMLNGRTVTLHAAAAWLTTTEEPAMVNVAERGEAVVLAAIFKPTVLPPVPLEVFNVIHGTGLWAVHAHSAPAFTEMAAVLAAPPTETAVGDAEYWQAPA